MQVKEKPAVRQTAGVKDLSNNLSALTEADFFDTKKRRKPEGKIGRCVPIRKRTERAKNHT